MATLMSIFSRRSLSLPSGESMANFVSEGTSNHATDSAMFGSLGENQQSIDFMLENVQQGLAGVEALVEQVSALKADVFKNFEEHRKLALANSALRQEHEQVQHRFAENLDLYKQTYAELVSQKSQAEEFRRNYERTRADLEALEHRHHLLGVAKRETEDQVERYATQVAAVQDELENLRLAVSSLESVTESQKAQILEITSKYNDSNSKALLLSNQCETLEKSLEAKSDEIIILNGKYDTIVQEQTAASLYVQQKEQELANAKAEAARLFQQSQSDKKSREAAINQLQAELGRARAKIKTLEDVNDETVAENMRLVLEVKRLNDLSEQSCVKIERLEASCERLNAKLEATVEAKAQTEQSRLTMSARLEAVTQLLAERENEAKRVSDEVTRLNSQIERETAMSKDVVESLEAKVFELEKELAAQRNETAFFASQAQASQRNSTQSAVR